MTHEYDPQSLLANLIAESDNPMVQGLKGLAVLTENQSSTSNELAAVVASRDAEVVAINEKWAPQLIAHNVKAKLAQEKIHTAEERIGRAALKGFRNHTLSDEELIYTDSLFVGGGYPGSGKKTIDFDYAAEQLTKFKQMTPGAPYLNCAYNATFGSRPTNIRGVHLGRAGILAAKPLVRLPKNSSYWYLDPQLDLTFKDGTTYTDSWSHRKAIGKEEVETIATIWASEHSISGRGQTGQYQLDHILDGLAKLAPLKLKLPQITEMRGLALEQVRLSGLSKPAETAKTLSDIRIVGGNKLFSKHVKLLVQERALDVEPLIEVVARALKPDYEDLTTAQRLSALQEAATVAQL